MKNIRTSHPQKLTKPSFKAFFKHFFSGLKVYHVDFYQMVNMYKKFYECTSAMPNIPIERYIYHYIEKFVPDAWYRIDEGDCDRVKEYFKKFEEANPNFYETESAVYIEFLSQFNLTPYEMCQPKPE